GLASQASAARGWNRMASPAPRISESAQLIPNPPTSVVESPKYSSHRAAPITHPTVKKSLATRLGVVPMEKSWN
ncbi:MAG: hypothetical protein OSB46_09545, partial [Alphaproteobacteria bacterium]|nr:hypothetical protein [Alphaproteobacteria bacterium]